MPDVTLLELRVTALDLASPAGGEPLEGLHERYLPELTLRGVEHHNSQYALCAAA